MTASRTLPAVDARRAVDLVKRLMAIPGPSGQEGAVIAAITTELRRAGVSASAIRADSVHRRSRFGGEAGNLILKLPGSPTRRREPRRMLLAHVDTVPICVGCQPVRRGGWIVSADPNTGLGADNRSGVAAILTAALEIHRRKLPHPPLTFFFPVQEEVGLIGARLVDLATLGRPRLAFNFDGGSPAKLTLGATGAYRLDITITGIASHAGVAPGSGVSALTVAAIAIADLHRRGWLGAIRKGRRRGTSNVGVIRAGQATNVVTERATLRAEVRSHDRRFRKMILKQFLAAFEKAARSVRNDAGHRGAVKVGAHRDYESFRLRRRDPVVAAAAAALRAAGADPIYAVTDGGVDANWLCAHGVPTVTLGAGQHHAHTTSEALNLDAFTRACGIALDLATG